MKLMPSSLCLHRRVYGGMLFLKNSVLFFGSTSLLPVDPLQPSVFIFGITELIDAQWGTWHFRGVCKSLQDTELMTFQQIQCMLCTMFFYSSPHGGAKDLWTLSSQVKLLLLQKTQIAFNIVWKDSKALSCSQSCSTFYGKASVRCLNWREKTHVVLHPSWLLKARVEMWEWPPSFILKNGILLSQMPRWPQLFSPDFSLFYSFNWQ